MVSGSINAFFTLMTVTPDVIHIHIKFKTRVKKAKVNSEKHTQVYGMYRAV